VLDADEGDHRAGGGYVEHVEHLHGNTVWKVLKVLTRERNKYLFLHKVLKVLKVLTKPPVGMLSAFLHVVPPGDAVI